MKTADVLLLAVVAVALGGAAFYVTRQPVAFNGTAPVRPALPPGAPGGPSTGTATDAANVREWVGVGKEVAGFLHDLF